MFEKIGPYGLTRSDLLVASIVIGFRIGAPKILVRSYVMLTVGLGAIIAGFLLRDWIPVTAGAFWILWLFIVGPMLRSLRNSHDIYLSSDESGVVADTPTHRTLYKWATIRQTRRIGSRLFIVIDSGLALVLADRMSTPENLDAVAATIRRYRNLSTNGSKVDFT